MDIKSFRARAVMSPAGADAAQQKAALDGAAFLHAPDEINQRHSTLVIS
jgi:hypothetical protein